MSSRHHLQGFTKKAFSQEVKPWICHLLTFFSTTLSKGQGSESGLRGSPFSIPSYLYKDLDKHVLRNSAGSDCMHTIREWSLANGMVVLAFVINESVEKFKMRSMCFSFASVLKCASCT